MSFDRGRSGFRYRCAMPGCTATVVVWSEEEHKHVNTYTPPAPWCTEYGGVWCACHWPEVEAYRAAEKTWTAQQQAHHRPLHLAARAQCEVWEKENPRPTPPWEEVAK